MMIHSGGVEMRKPTLFPHLFQSLSLGNLTLANRIMMPAMHLGYCPTGEVTDQLIEFYRLRAKGGAGLIIVGGCGIDKIGNTWGMIQVDEDRFIPGLQRLAEAVQTEGSKIMAQLYQSGRYAVSALTGQPAVAPSPIPSKLTGETPHELSLPEIKNIISSFAQAAQRVQEAGFNGVEILAGTGYLISEFLSPVTNHRTDEYGGDLENRMRFALEIVHAIRDTVGPDFPLLARIAGNDFIPGGHTNEEAKSFAQALEKAGVTAIDVTGGWHETLVPQITMNVPPGAFRYLARGIKSAVSIPVIACNRINTPALAEEILSSEEADLVGIARPLIADPYFPKKAYLEGLKDPHSVNPTPRIRPCIACNQGCLDHVFRLKPVACLTNAEAGQEAELRLSTGILDEQTALPFDAEAEAAPTLEVPGSIKRILVLGAGPAGLEFARVASLRGHQVTVWEKNLQTGGQLNLAGAPPGRQDFLRLKKYLEAVCLEQGVELLLNQLTPFNELQESITRECFTDVVLATGATPLQPPIPIEAGAPVMQAWDILTGQDVPGKNILILGGGAVGIETALYLADRGTLNAETLRFLILNQAETPQALGQLLLRGHKNLTLVEMASGIGRDIGSSTRWSMLADLKRHQVKVYTGTTVTRITREGVWVRTPEEEKLLPCDMAVLAVGSVPENSLYQELQKGLPSSVELHLIGDAHKPAKVLDAIREAYREAVRL